MIYFQRSFHLKTANTFMSVVDVYAFSGVTYLLGNTYHYQSYTNNQYASYKKEYFSVLKFKPWLSHTRN